jgi:hypothetical protein
MSRGKESKAEVDGRREAWRQETWPQTREAQEVTMATPGQTPQMAPPQQGGAPAASGGSAMQGAKQLAAIIRLAQMTSQAFPATSPEMDQILTAAQTASRKLIQASPDQQGQQAPPF